MRIAAGVRKDGYTALCLRVILAAVILTLGTSQPGLCQIGNGALTGTVTDNSGAMVPSADVSITNSATGLVRNTRTNGDGIYAIPSLPPGSSAPSRS